MIDNAKIAKIEEDIKATNAKVKVTDAKVDATNAKVDATDAKVNSINQVPASTAADAGKVLTVGDDGTVSWQTKGAGGGMKAFFDAGGKCGQSTATSFDGIINFGDTADVENMNYMFDSCHNLITIPLIDTSKVTSMSFMFQFCTSLTTIPQLDTSNVNDMQYMFFGCQALTTVPEIDVFKVTNMFYMFGSCDHLEEIHMRNIVADLDIQSSTLFTHDALMEIINNLGYVVTNTLTMGADNLAKLTDEDKAIATNKGWTLA